jgi:histidinol-phosphatase (PHP family)
LDYTLGSVHLLGQLPDHSWWTVDNSFIEFEAGLRALFDGNIRQAVEHYYTSVKTMVATSPPDIIGHLDRIKRNNYANQFFSEQEEWYRTLVTTTLDVIAHSGCIIEVNTGTAPAILYPSEWILDECLRRHIPVTVNSDAHSPDGIARCFEEVAQQLQNIGFHSIRTPTRDGWVDVPV